ncbi:MAG: AAA family ATPase, partial [Candidatus Caldarchaeum sp.]
DKVNVAFREMFCYFFGGGDARLVLTNPDNLLETGVDIEVVIPGKKTQRLELLSGGERALAACALVFALLKVRPSPVVILDELDAPLDATNVERFVQVVHEFSQRSQFIVVTHNPITIHGSPVWYGVSMQEPGVSTIVPYRDESVHLNTLEREGSSVPTVSSTSRVESQT